MLLTASREIDPRLKSGLEAAWLRAEGNSAIDCSPYANHGTGTGSPAISRAVTGLPACDLSGSNYYSVPDSDSISVRDSASVSVGALIYWRASTEAYNSILARTSGTSGQANGYSMFVTSAGKLAAYIANAATNVGVDPGGTVPASTWTHVGMVYDGASLTTYINGYFDATTAGSQTFATTSATLYLGAQIGRGAGRYFNGLIAAPYLYSRALSAAEMLLLAQLSMRTVR